MLLVLMLTPFFSAHAITSERPFNNAANWGGTGLMEIPNARVLEDGEIRAGIAQADPFRWYSPAMGVFPGLEVDFRLTEFLNSPIIKPGWEGYGNNKDKTLDLKYQIFPESKKFPAMAVGLHDFQGVARQFPAKYLVFSRQIFPFDFTFGIGSGRLKGETSLPFFSDFGPFGGIEYALNDRINLMAEYNPIDYEKDNLVVAAKEGASSNLNIGIRYIVLEGIHLGLSFQRGDTLGAMLHIQTKLGKPLRNKRPDHPPLAPIDTRPFKGRDTKALVERLRRAISGQGYLNVRVYTDEADLTVEFENTRYLSDQKAMGRVLRIALFYAPEDTGKITVISKRLDINVLRVSVSLPVLSAFFHEKISTQAFLKQIDVELTDPGKDKTGPGYTTSEDYRMNDLFLGVKPDFEPYLNDPSGFFKYRLNVKPYVKWYPWKGGVGYARLAIPLYSTVSTSLPTPQEDAIRSDLVDYRGTEPSFDRFLYEHTLRLSQRISGRISVGYFEDMFAGIGGELLTYPGDGRLAFGIEGDWARKRKPGTLFELEDLRANTLLGNLYYSVPSMSMVLQAQYGKFLAEDVGWRFTVSREYDTGVVLGAWYTITDTSHLTGFNRDYNDKGIFISLPVEMFKTTSDTRRFQYSASPWTRDVGQTVRHTSEIYGTTIGLMPFRFRHFIEEMKK